MLAPPSCALAQFRLTEAGKSTEPYVALRGQGIRGANFASAPVCKPRGSKTDAMRAADAL